MQPVHARVVRRLFARLDDLRIDLLARPVHHFLDAPGVNAPVGDELLQRQPCHLAADRIEAGDHDGVRGVVDDDVHSGGQLERADVPAFATDDPALHLVVRERHGGDGGFGGGLRGDSLDGQGDDLLRLPLGVAPGPLADLAEHVGRVRLRLLLEAPQELRLGVLSGHPGELLEPTALFAEQPLELLLSALHDVLAATEVARAPPDVAIALLHRLGTALERGFALAEVALFSFDRAPSRPNFLLGGFAKADQLFLPRDDGGLS